MTGHARHGHAIGGKPSPTYRSWTAMIARCTYPSQPQYESYGGRGISVCERWRSFDNFLADMGERPAGTTLDRIDNDGTYEPGNCRWATPTEQQTNKRPGRHRNTVKTHCPAGHAYDEANTYVTRHGHRLCRACHRERERVRKARLREAAR